MIGERLKEIRERTGMNKKEFADFIGIKYTTYNNYETEAREPASDFLILISTKFDVSIDYILGLQAEKEILHSYKLKSSEYDHIKKYRLISENDTDGKILVDSTIDYLCKKIEEKDSLLKEIQNQKIIHAIENTTPLTRIISYYHRLASAGSGEYLFDNIPTDNMVVPLNEISKQADFVIGVNGHSMEPTYSDGNNVYVRITDEIPIGSVGVFTKGNECFVKELGTDRLISHNKEYADIPAGEDIRLVGEVIGKVETA